MKRFLLVSLLTVWFYFYVMFALLWAQVKPASPSLQAGWSTNCIRALLLNEGTGTTVDDMSPVDAACALNVSTLWASDTEGNYVDTGLAFGNDYISLNTGLPGAGINSLTWYWRINWFYSSGAILGLAATFTGSPPTSDIQWYSPVENMEPQFLILNASDVCVACNIPNAFQFAQNTKYNVIGTYDGDSIKVYVNGVKKCSVAQTGNIRNHGYTTRVGEGTNGEVGGAGNCGGASVNFPRMKVYTICVWQRVITSTEIAQIQDDPYVMFGAGGGRRRQIVQ